MARTVTKLSTALVLLSGLWGALPSVSSAADHFESTIAFTSNRDNLSLPIQNLLRFEVYLMDADGENVRRLTHNSDADGLASLSPEGKRVAFDSNRNRADYSALCGANSLFVSDLFLMDTDGSPQTLLRRGASSATWSPDGKYVAFHASASGLGCPSRTDPGAAATDSDIFVAKVGNLLDGTEQPKNLTNTSQLVDDDADWSPSGDRIAFTAHDVGDDIPNGMGALSNSAELYVMNVEGNDREPLTDTAYEEERAPAWSPSGDRLAYSCRIGGGANDFEICVIDADGTNTVQLTDNLLADLTATWSPDGERLVFQRPTAQGNQLFTMEPELGPGDTLPTATQLTFGPGGNLLANWGRLRVTGDQPAG